MTQPLDVILECLECHKVKLEKLGWVPKTHVPEYEIYRSHGLVSHGYCGPCGEKEVLDQGMSLEEFRKYRDDLPPRGAA